MCGCESCGVSMLLVRAFWSNHLLMDFGSGCAVQGRPRCGVWVFTRPRCAYHIGLAVSLVDFKDYESAVC